MSDPFQALCVLNSDFEIERSLVLSTHHITQSDSELLAQPDLSGHPVVVYNYKEGMWVHVPSRDDEVQSLYDNARAFGFSEAFCDLIFLVQTLRKAKFIEITHLRFDADGPVVPGLKKYHW